MLFYVCIIGILIPSVWADKSLKLGVYGSSQTIASYCPVDILHLKLFTQNILTCIQAHCFHGRSKHSSRSQ